MYSYVKLLPIKKLNIQRSVSVQLFSFIYAFDIRLGKSIRPDTFKFPVPIY